MSTIIVSDTGPLIALGLVRLVHLMPKLFSVTYVTDGVLEEALRDSGKPGAQEIRQALERGWIQRHDVVLNDAARELSELLDQGEAEALALAEQIQAIALIDEKRGRRVVEKRNIPVTGTAAVLIKAKHEGLIPLVKPLLNDLAQHGYRLSSELIDHVLQVCGEMH